MSLAHPHASRSFSLWGIMALSLLFARTLPAAEPLLLVTEDELQASMAAPEPLFPRFAPEPDAPRILVETPKLNASLSSPITMKLKFQPAPGTTIRPETFKVRYGSLGIDITARITGSTTVTSEGLEISQAALPKGKHKLVIAVEDAAGRSNERQLQFEII
jgi:hypothetical protein